MIGLGYNTPLRNRNHACLAKTASTPGKAIFYAPGQDLVLQACCGRNNVAAKRVLLLLALHYQELKLDVFNRDLRLQLAPFLLRCFWCLHCALFLRTYL